MADNVTTQSGTLATVPAGATFAFDEIGGALYGRSKIGIGPDGAYTEVSLANPLPVRAYAAGATVTSVADSASNQTLAAANAFRQAASVYNDSTAALYLKLGATASATSFSVLIPPGGYYEVPAGYVGQIDGVWASDASGAARITEVA